uniref:carbonic anhydrase n=1 Tax=Grammatophora oceanica TaxID=210454 RepID=A0A7S1YE76_9STRA
MTMNLLPSISLSLLLSATIVVVVAQDPWNEGFRLDYSYDPTANNGPSAWNDVGGLLDSEWDWYDRQSRIYNLAINDNDCGEEDRPSPISLNATTGCSDVREMRTPQARDDHCQADNLAYVLTPQSLKAYFPIQRSNGCRNPWVELDGFGEDEFVLVWMELHMRSEHVIEGRRYDAELQMVHMGTDDNENRMAIVSLMLDASSLTDNLDLQPLLDGWQQTANNLKTSCPDRKLSVRRARPSLKSSSVKAGDEDLTESIDKTRHRQMQDGCKGDVNGNGCDGLGPRKRIFPYNLWPSIWYYRYAGSITAPPCTSIVQWRVMEKPLTMSTRQMKQLAQLQNSYKTSDCAEDDLLSPTGENFRPLQSRSQQVLHCTYDNFGYTMYAPEDQ